MTTNNNFDPQKTYIETLTKAFEEFNTNTTLLTKSYDDLQQQVKEINFQLEEKNRELEQSLNETDRVRNYLNNILESMNSGVVAIDLNGRITIFNQAAEEITGWKADQLIDRFYSDYLGREVPYQLTLNYTLLAGQNIINKEKEIQTSRGGMIPIGFSTGYITDRKGAILGAVEIFRDLTEFKKLEDEIIKKSTLAGLGEMAATVAHEIRNPLGGIAGFANLLSRDIPQDDPKFRLVQKISQGVESLNKIVSNLLAFTREFRPQFQMINLMPLIQHAQGMIQSEINERGLSIPVQLEGGKDDFELKADKDLLLQAIYNILYNSVDAIACHSVQGTIEIVLEREPIVEAQKQRWEYITKTPASMSRRILVHIRDTGCGIDSRQMDKIFNPFFTTKENGTGLGLAIVKKIIILHKGNVTVESSLAEGTTITLILPGL